MAIKIVLAFSLTAFLICSIFYFILSERKQLISNTVFRNNLPTHDLSEMVLRKLHERRKNRNPNLGSSEIEPCQNQREGYYIQFLDVSLSGPGLLHRKEDFKSFVKFAFNTRRILVDNVPELASRHASLDKRNGNLLGNRTKRAFESLPMGFFFDVENIIMERKFGNVCTNIYYI